MKSKKSQEHPLRFFVFVLHSRLVREETVNLIKFLYGVLTETFFSYLLVSPVLADQMKLPISFHYVDVKNSLTLLSICYPYDQQ